MIHHHHPLPDSRRGRREEKTRDATTHAPLDRAWEEIQTHKPKQRARETHPHYYLQRAGLADRAAEEDLDAGHRLRTEGRRKTDDGNGDQRRQQGGGATTQGGRHRPAPHPSERGVASRVTSLGTPRHDVRVSTDGGAQNPQTRRAHVNGRRRANPQTRRARVKGRRRAKPPEDTTCVCQRTLALRFFPVT